MFDCMKSGEIDHVMHMVWVYVPELIYIYTVLLALATEHVSEHVSF